MTTGTCPVCLSSSQPLESNMELYGTVAFHRRCESKLFAAEFVTEMEAVFSVNVQLQNPPPDPPPEADWNTLRFNGFSWVDDEDYFYP